MAIGRMANHPRMRFVDHLAFLSLLIAMVVASMLSQPCSSVRSSVCEGSVSTVIDLNEIVADREHVQASLGNMPVLLAFDWDLQEVQRQDVLNLLQQSNLKAVFLLNGDTLGTFDSLLRQMVRDGHLMVIKRITVPSELEASEEALVATIRREAAFLESAVSKFPMFVRNHKDIYGDAFVSGSRKAEVFILDLPASDRGSMSSSTRPLIYQNADAVQMIQSDALRGKLSGIQHFLDSDQLHCLYDRLNCDHVAYRELYFEICNLIRNEFYAREKVDLNKYASRLQSYSKDKIIERYPYDITALSQPMDGSKKPKTFVNMNRNRVEAAYHRIKTGTLLREIMIILYTLTNDELENLEGNIEFEMARVPSRLIRVLYTFGLCSLLLGVYMIIRYPPPIDLIRSLINRRKSGALGVGPGSALKHRLTDYNKAS